LKSDHAIRLVLFTACLLLGFWAFRFWLPPVSEPWAAVACPAAITSFFVGVPFFVYGDKLAEAEAWVLRRLIASFPDPNQTEVLVIKSFGMSLMVWGVSTAWLMQ